ANILERKSMSDDRFVGRRKELQELKALTEKKTASLVVVKGRRRVGKSRLLEEFSKNKQALKFIGLPPQKETNKQRQLDEFARQLSQVTSLPSIQADNWGTLFTLLFSQVAEKRVILIFDEISWMLRHEADWKSCLLEETTLAVA